MSSISPAAETLSHISDDELPGTIQAALEERIGSAHASELATMLAAYLVSDSHVRMLAGAPRRVLDSVSDLAREEAIRASAHRAILGETMLTSRGVGEALGRRGAAGREAARMLRNAGEIIGLEQGNTFIHPAFQFDLARARVHPVVAEVNRLLGAAKDPWGVASWWTSVNGYLGSPPTSLIGRGQDDRLRRLARGVVEDF